MLRSLTSGGLLRLLAERFAESARRAQGLQANGPGPGAEAVTPRGVAHSSSV
jgi:hypothetical protein